MFKNKTTSTVKATSSNEEQAKNTVISMHFKSTGFENWYRKDHSFHIPQFLDKHLPNELQIKYTDRKNKQGKYILVTRKHRTNRVFTRLRLTLGYQYFQKWVKSTILQNLKFMNLLGI